MFPTAVTEHWLGGHEVPSGAYAVVVDAAPLLGRPLQLLDLGDRGLIRLTAPYAARLGVAAGAEVDPGSLGVGWDDADQLFYLPSGTAPGGASASTRRLGTGDDAAFAELVAACSPADVDEAFVELDHALVVGTVVGGRLVSAASAYRWHGTPFGDIGVLTAPDARGRGHGTATVRALAEVVAGEGLEPQYRCDVTNTASAGLAAAAGFRRFARWSLPAD